MSPDSELFPSKDGGNRLVESAGERLFCLDCGQGRPLLFLHGWPLDHRVWTPQIEFFSRSYRVLAMDRRGFGQSTGSANLGNAVEDIDAILDDCGVESATLIGMSRGGRIALRYAFERPQRVNGLVLVGPALDGYNPPPDPEEDIPLAHYAELAKAGDFAALREAWLSHPLMALHAGGPDLRDRVAQILEGYRGQDFLGADAPTADVPDVASHLDRIIVPSLVVVGAHETAGRQAIAEKLVKGLPNAEFTVIHEAGHLLNLEQPEIFNQRVTEFLERHGLDQKET